MKKYLLILIMTVCGALYSYSADPATVVAPTSTATNNYVLYPTNNHYTFLKLDTRNGKIWQVQFSLDENEFEVVLNNKSLAAGGRPGQFALYPTTNNWTFILLDTIYGNVWHIQWSQDPSYRGIYPIKLLE